MSNPSKVKSDINICHEIPSKRRDGKRVVICKFMTRKSKLALMKAKKGLSNPLKYGNNIIFVNEHLSPNNRRLFALASAKKRELNFKFLWTKHGTAHLRKSKGSPVFSITCDVDLDKLG